jgi:hypothetical protein
LWGWAGGVVLWDDWGGVGNWLLFNQLGEGGDGSGDFSGDGRRGWQMVSDSVVAGLVSVPLDGDGDSFWGGVGRGTLGGDGFSVFLSSVLQLSLLLNLDAITGFETETYRSEQLLLVYRNGEIENPQQNVKLLQEKEEIMPWSIFY